MKNIGMLINVFDLKCISICLTVLSVAVFISAMVFFFVRINKRRKAEKYNKTSVNTILVISVLLFISIWFLRFAIAHLNGDGAQKLVWGEELVKSCLETLRSFGVEDDFYNFITDVKSLCSVMNCSYHWQNVIIVYASILCIIAPVFSGTIILELFASTFPKFRLRLEYCLWWRKKYYFSELNPASLALAKSIVEKENKNVILVFTDTYIDGENEKEYELLLEAKRLGAICLRDDLSHVSKSKYGKKEYYLMDANEFGNFQTLMGLIEKHNIRFLKDSTVYLFVQTDAYVQIEKQINQKFNDNGYESECKPKIVPVRAFGNIVTNLFEDIPLYEPLINKCQNSASLNITILGNGHIGTEAFLNAYWFGQMFVSQEKDGKKTTENCDLTINVVSKDTEKEFWAKIDYINPEIKNTVNLNKADKQAEDKYCNVIYKQCDVKIGGFWDKETEGNKNEDSDWLLNSDYYIVALGNDADNISVAEKLFHHIGKKHLGAEKDNQVNNVIIAYAVFDSNIAKMLNTKKYHKCCDNKKKDIFMYAFGSLEQVYSYDNISMSKSKLLANGAGSAYIKKQVNEKHIEDNVKRSQRAEEGDYNYWANIAKAMHIKYKAFSLGLFEKSLFDFDDITSYEQYSKERCDLYKQMVIVKKIEKNFENNQDNNSVVYGEYAANVIDFLDDDAKKLYFDIETKIHLLAWLEHRRWNAFTRTMGYQYTDKMDKNLKLNGRTHKNMELKLHPCLVEAKRPELNKNNKYKNDGLQKLFDKFEGKYSKDNKIRKENIAFLEKQKAFFETKQKLLSSINKSSLDELDKTTYDWCKITTDENLKRINDAIKELNKLKGETLEEVILVNIIDSYDFKQYDYYDYELDEYGFEIDLIENLKALKIPNPSKYCDHEKFEDSICCNTNGNKSYLISVESVKWALDKDYKRISDKDNVKTAFEFDNTKYATKTNFVMAKAKKFLLKNFTN